MPSVPEAKVSVVVIADGPWEETLRCLTALAVGTAGVPHEVVVVDDGTTDETGVALPRLPGITAVRGDLPQGFAAAANAGAELSSAPFIAFLHGDAVPHPGWLAPLLRLAEEDAAVAAVASRLLAPTGLVEGDGVVFGYAMPYPMTPAPLGAGEPGIPSLEVSEVPAASAIALLVRREAFTVSGGFDLSYTGPAADLDLCLRLGEAGGLVLVARESVAVHHARCSAEISDTDATRLTKRWLGRVPLLSMDQGAAERPATRRAGAAVSVVVPIRNALGTVAPCLECLLAELGPADELVTADAGSDDGTAEFLALFAREHLGRVRLVSSGAWGGLEEALRAGLAAASNPAAVVVHAGGGPAGGLLGALTDQREREKELLVRRGPGGAGAAGPLELLRDLAGGTPGAFFDPDPAILVAAVAALGGTAQVLPERAA